MSLGHRVQIVQKFKEMVEKYEPDPEMGICAIVEITAMLMNTSTTTVRILVRDMDEFKEFRRVRKNVGRKHILSNDKKEYIIRHFKSEIGQYANWTVGEFADRMAKRHGVSITTIYNTLKDVPEYKMVKGTYSK